MKSWHSLFLPNAGSDVMDTSRDSGQATVSSAESLPMPNALPELALQIAFLASSRDGVGQGHQELASVREPVEEVGEMFRPMHNNASGVFSQGGAIGGEG